MHKLSDLVSFLFTTAFVVGTVLVIALCLRKCTAAIDSTKSSLEKRGWKVSSHGMSVPIGKPTLHDRERYLDATQRGLSKAANASTFGGPGEPSSSAGQWSGKASTSRAGEEQRHHRLHLFKRHMD
jgi:hypothetical protein